MDGVVVISGGGTGIGAAIARTVAADGGHALILGRREEVLRSTEKTIAQESGSKRVSWRQVDATEPAQVEAFASFVGNTYGTVLGLVNNAGGDSSDAGDRFAHLKDTWIQTYEQNVISAVLLTTALEPWLQRPGGRIINISSMSTRYGVGRPSYVAAKGALNSWTLALTRNFARQRITVNAVLPGLTPDTEFFGGTEIPISTEEIERRFPFGRAGRPEDVAGAVRYLLSPEACYVTGQIIEIAGGVSPPSYS